MQLPSEVNAREVLGRKGNVPSDDHRDGHRAGLHARDRSAITAPRSGKLSFAF
jgi:hypothetical protein